MFYEQKDLDRIDSMISKSKGDFDKLINLASNMADAIKDPIKALRRAYAAQARLQFQVAGIFMHRHHELTR